MALTCFLAPDPIQGTYFIPGGNTPANGGQVFFYLAGTSTKTTVYKDNAGGTAWSNPIVLDSGGNLPSGGEVWIVSGQTVKAVFAPSNDTDPPASPYWSKDNLNGVNDFTNPNPSIGFITGRLTAASGQPITTSDVATTRIFYTPFVGNLINIYDGSANWVLYTYSEIGLTMPTSTAVYDVYITNSSGSLTLTTQAWNGDFARQTSSLVIQNGMGVNGNALNQLYLGTVYSSSGVVRDQAAFRYLYNWYNQVDRPMRVVSSSNAWSYSTNAVRQANADAANALSFVVGGPAMVRMDLQHAARATSAAYIEMATGIGVNTTTVFTTSGTNDYLAVSSAATAWQPLTARYVGYPAIGRNTFNWLEFVNGNVTSATFGNTGSVGINIGMTGSLKG